jgi:hypothetical protein
MMAYLIVDSFFLIAFIVKDILDERQILKAKSPIGPSWIEHGPLAFMILLQLLITLSTDTDNVIKTIKIVLSIVFVIDIVWDLWQDFRSRTFRNK